MSKNKEVNKGKNKTSTSEDIFVQAASEATFEQLESENEVVVVDQQELAKLHSEEGSKWDNLTKYMDGNGADRMLVELRALSGKNYVSAYLKLLEHFRPKLTRVESKPMDDIDRTINIQLVQMLPDGEKRVINIDDTN